MKLRFIQPDVKVGKSTENPNHLLIQEISRNCSSNSASLCKTDTLFVIYAHCVSWCKSLFYAQDAHALTQSFTPTPLIFLQTYLALIADYYNGPSLRPLDIRLPSTLYIVVCSIVLSSYFKNSTFETKCTV